jgi:hypothetical protein
VRPFPVDCWTSDKPAPLDLMTAAGKADDSVGWGTHPSNWAAFVLVGTNE